MQREQIAALIVERLHASATKISSEFRLPGRIQSAIIDDLLPQDLAQDIAAAFPAPQQLNPQVSLRERKLTSKKLHVFPAILEETTFAFQGPRVVEAIQNLTGIPRMHGDPNLYAGGISLMQRGDFLLPHLDNSHDKDRRLYRVLNLLYYVSPGWAHESGGNFELWDSGPGGAPREIVSAFNRLVLMATHQSSWHSVNQVSSDTPRTCISNYYFSDQPMEGHDYFHVTSFRARPGQIGLDMFLRADSVARRMVRTVFKTGVYQPAVYQPPKDKMD